MILTEEELELDAVQRLRQDIQSVLDNHVLELKGTSAFMIVNKCADELIYLEQYAMLQDHLVSKVG